MIIKYINKSISLTNKDVIEITRWSLLYEIIVTNLGLLSQKKIIYQYHENIYSTNKLQFGHKNSKNDRENKTSLWESEIKTNWKFLKSFVFTWQYLTCVYLPDLRLIETDRFTPQCPSAHQPHITSGCLDHALVQQERWHATRKERVHIPDLCHGSPSTKKFDLCRPFCLYNEGRGARRWQRGGHGGLRSGSCLNIKNVPNNTQKVLPLLCKLGMSTGSKGEVNRGWN